MSSVDDPTSDEKKTFAITIREVKGAKLKREIELQTKPGMIAWSPDCKLIVYSLPSSIIVLDAHSMREIAKIPTNSAKALDFCWSPDKKHLAYADDGTIHILDAITMIERVKIDGATNGRFRLAWSPDSNYILLSAGETAAICDIKSGKYLGYKHWQDTRSHTISPDQNTLTVETINKLTTDEPLTLPPKPDMSPFENGKTGSPGWENNATPKTIEEAFAEFDKDLIPANRQRYKRAAQSDIGNFGGRESITDTMMADVYYKWNFTPLYKFFEARGITKEREVLGILLDSYWRHLNDKPIDLGTQISTHKAYWDDQKTVIAPNQQLPESIWLCPQNKLRHRIFA
ncbi:MAG: WD40 repeat domain-containing protein [Candidatus Obscuribacter sp.]|nr:WD40 repeat domain-containing protein [Candidatus Obscuribacter sp.]